MSVWRGNVRVTRAGPDVSANTPPVKTNVTTTVNANKACANATLGTTAVIVPRYVKSLLYMLVVLVVYLPVPATL